MQAFGKETQSKIDWLLCAGVAGLMLMSVAFIYSATLANDPANLIPWYRERCFMQLIWYVIGLGAAVAICLVDYHILARWSLVGYWATILLLIAVLIPGIGKTHGWGARRWIDLAFFQAQPSEFAKLSFILAQAHFLSRPADELRLSSVFWKALGLTVLPFLLIMNEPDLGSALILLPVGLTMLYVAGVPVRFLFRLIGGAGLIVVLILVDVLLAPPGWQIKLEEYQKRRLQVYFGVDSGS